MDDIAEQPGLWTGNFILISQVNFLIMFAYYQITAILALHAMENLAATSSQAGLVAGILIVAALIARLLTGKSIEEIGRKRTMIIGLAIKLIAILLYFFAQSIPLLFVVRILHGIGFGISTTATITIVANIVPQSRRGEGIGYFMLSTTLAAAVGPSLGIFLYQTAGFASILSAAAIVAAAGLIMAFIVRVPASELSADHLENMKKFTLSNFFEVRVLPMALVGFLVFLSYSSIIGFFSAYASSIGLMEIGSLFFLVYSGATLISRPFTSRWFDRKGENYVVYPSLVIFAVGLVGLGFARGGLLLLTAGALLGIGFGTFVPSAQTIAVNMVEDHRVGVASSTFLAISETGIGFGPFFLGFLLAGIGYRSLYFSLAGVVAVTIVLYHILHGKAASKKNRRSLRASPTGI